MTTYNQPFQLLSQVLNGATKRRSSDNRMFASQIKATEQFNECHSCGMTWSLDEDDSCPDC